MNHRTRPSLHTRSSRRVLALLVCAWVFVSSAAAQDKPIAPQDVVLRHNGLEPLVGEITLIDSAGVSMSGPNASTTMIPWHTVRDIDSEKHSRDWKRYQKTAEQLWRAVSRVERGDPTLAEAIFERQFEQYRGQTHETALVVAEGLLRCKLARAMNESAVVPWLETARMREAGITTAAFEDLDPVIDASTLLCPQLPPAWPRTSRVDRLRDDLSKYAAGNSPVIAALANMYNQFAQLESGSAIEVDAKTLPKHPGVELLSELLALRNREPNAAAIDITRVERRAATLPSWAQAWMRYQLGLALLEEDKRHQQDLGLVQLANLPARYRFGQPYLAGLALRDMAAVLEKRGDAEHAASLRRLVQERYPGHPAADAVSFVRVPELKANP